MTVYDHPVAAPTRAISARLRRAMALLFATTLVLGAWPAAAQESTGISQRSIRCHSLANPNKLYSECTTAPFSSAEETLTGSWNGVRDELQALGITPTLSYTTQLLTDPGGQGGQQYAYAGTVALSITWDFGKLFGVSGLSFHISGSQSSGTNLSADIGNLFTVASAYSGHGLNLDEIYLQQQGLNQHLTLAIGRLAPANTFATLPVYGNYVNAGINSYPGSIGANEKPFTSSPVGVEWGAQGLYYVRPDIQVGVGVYTTNAIAATGGQHGLNFDFQPSNGVLTVGQINYLYNQAANATGMPGQYSLGAYYDSSKFPSLTGSYSVFDNYGLYAMAQQMVYRPGGPGSQQGLTLWATVTYAPKQEVNQIPWFLGGGASYQGLLPGRPQDTASLGVIYGVLSKCVPNTSAETVLEINYQIALTRWLTFMPDFQYVFQPSGSSAITNSAVAGFQAVVTF
jgi:porin